MVSLATMATIIASQALISGAYSLTAQAIALGYGGRMDITHTSTEHVGQIYIRTLNWLLCAGCLVLIFTFQSSSHLASAYGLAVSGVMLSTSLAMIPLAVLRWRWSVLRASLLFGFFAGLEGHVSPGQYAEISGRRVRAARHWPGPLCGHVQLSLGPALPCWPRRMPGLRPSETCAGSSP